MTQTDGETPTAAELRALLGRARINTNAYLQALTAAAVGMDKQPTLMQTYELLAILSAAHHDLTLHMDAALTSLGLPYEKIVEVEFEEIPYD